MTEYFFNPEQVKMLQAKPYEEKVRLTISKILEFIHLTDSNVYVAYSGGKDSGVLLDLVAKAWSLVNEDKPLTVAFANTTCECAGMIPHIKNFVETIEKRCRVTIDFHISQPELNFSEVIKDVGYPIASKLIATRINQTRNVMKRKGITWDMIKDHLDQTIENADYLRNLGLTNSTVSYLCGIKSDNTKASSKTMLSRKWIPLIYAPFHTSDQCCMHLKKQPQKQLAKDLGLYPILGEMAEESSIRRTSYMKTGCIFLSDNEYKCKPMGFWTEKDIYIDTTMRLSSHSINTMGK